MCKDLYRFSAERIYVEEGPRQAAQFLIQDLRHKTMNRHGFYELSDRLNIVPSGILDTTTVFCFMLGRWHVFHDFGLPTCARFFISLQRFGELLEYESKMTGAPDDSISKEYWMKEWAPSYIFAMELCFPESVLREYIAHNVPIDRIAENLETDEILLRKWLKKLDIDASISEELENYDYFIWR